jgi:hypothetical protein
VPEQSSFWQDSKGSSSFFSSGRTKKDYASLTVSGSVIAGSHLWRERNLMMPNILFSDALQDEIARQGLRIPKHNRLRVV